MEETHRLLDSIGARCVVVNDEPPFTTLEIIAGPATGICASVRPPSHCQPNAASATNGVGPQAGLPQRRSIQVILYRTQNGGNVYRQVAAPAVVKMSAAPRLAG